MVPCHFLQATDYMELRHRTAELGRAEQGKPSRQFGESDKVVELVRRSRQQQQQAGDGK